ncbi:MAG: hypothetical protein KM310_10370 [Clostridiales bacterium]|nr:hypothetical protein [Clostridiales bacterium]
MAIPILPVGRPVFPFKITDGRCDKRKLLNVKHHTRQSYVAVEGIDILAAPESSMNPFQVAVTILVNGHQEPIL